MTREIPFDEEQTKEFYERFGASHFKLQAETNKAYASHLIGVYFKSVSFTATVVGTIGIIAGFGFTALDFVESKALFFIGEGLLIYSILHGLIWIQNVYKGEFGSLDRAHNRNKDYFEKRNKKFKEVWDQISTSGKVAEQDFKDLVNINSEVVQVFAPPEVITTDKKEKMIFSKKLYYLMVAGSLCLLSSFFVYSLFCSIR